ncbi:MAG: HIT domain-containing protein [Candidatus Peribacteraceae bacterium]|nr:HIT domain-containing protein [Candidatus Peribacteraceae bacterium]
MTERTIFHKIRDREIPADIVYEDEDVLIFQDIHPKAPTHLLLIAKKDSDFVPSIADVTAETAHVPLLLIRKAQQFARERGVDGYKLTFHVGRGGGQEVFYLHLHFMSQQQLVS